MNNYIGIHSFIGYNDIGVEKLKCSSKKKAYELMERNDSNLLVLSKRQFEKVKKAVEENSGGMIKTIK